MFEVVNLSIAMENADKNVKQRAANDHEKEDVELGLRKLQIFLKF